MISSKIKSNKTEKTEKSVDKPWAYSSPKGSKWVTAETIKRRRILEKNGGSLGEDFYSSDWPRKKMGHRISNKGNPSFYYINSSGSSGTGGSGGESLAHRLFKDALLKIKETTLKIKGLGDFRVELYAGDTEVTIGNNEYRIDAYRKFHSNTYLEKKWSGEIYIEVHNTNPVENEKRNRLIKERIPTIEISIPNIFKFDIPEDQATDKDIEEYFKRVQRITESQNGFLPAMIISNPSSIEYLEELTEQQAKKINKSNLDISTLNECVSALTNQVQSKKHIEEHLTHRLEQQKNQYEATLNQKENEIKKLEKAVHSMERALECIEAKNKSLHNNNKNILIFLSITSALLVLSLLYILR
ncbi:hypothetical protein LQR30_15495 [Chromobacterium piscinae]|uniref:hypothetical protein n=1 Tax=Chromobacterium piscinae TaxID=686831 RepID=UPI001E330472|nr:hypothetical protein [Chromobacterium piscinae]MCD4505502.1 hypothetical protein [Chromobacterium piscinae]